MIEQLIKDLLFYKENLKRMGDELLQLDLVDEHELWPFTPP